MKLDRDVIHSMIEKAGYQCGKNTAMVDVFDRFSQLVIEHLKEQDRDWETSLSSFILHVLHLLV